MDLNDRTTQIFLDVQRGLPRQAPGDDASTLRALAMCTELPPRPDVLDVGCGPGRQTLALAREIDGHIYAGDLMQEYLDQLVASAEAEGLRDMIGQMRLDMVDLPFGRDTFDLIWSEGAAYILGFGEAFKRWAHPLRPRGYMAVTELVWSSDDRPSEVAAFFANEYPAMTDVPTNIATVEAAGFELIGHFTLPDAAWWDHYYTPLEAKLPGLREKYAGDEDAMVIVEATATEIDMRRRFADSYGYEFFVARAADPDAAGADVGEGGGSAAANDAERAPNSQQGEPDRPASQFPPPMDD